MMKKAVYLLHVYRQFSIDFSFHRPETTVCTRRRETMTDYRWREQRRHNNTNTGTGQQTSHEQLTATLECTRNNRRNNQDDHPHLERTESRLPNISNINQPSHPLPAKDGSLAGLSLLSRVLCSSHGEYGTRNERAILTQAKHLDKTQPKIANTTQIQRRTNAWPRITRNSGDKERIPLLKTFR